MIALLLVLLSVAPAPGAVSGVVRDATGAVIADAAVIVRGDGAEVQTITRGDGTFAVAAPATGDLVVTVRAVGFTERQLRITPRDASPLEVVLEPAAVLETVAVTATRTEQRLGNVPARLTVLSAEDIRSSPALVADDVLRQLPEFTLFRRTSSLSSHPTAQGVSLRGIGPSGVSRTLVLLDDVPFNDPFGGWVYWSRVPLESTERVEVVDGASSSLYGNYAMGGVISIRTIAAVHRLFDAKAQYGSRNSPKGDVVASATSRGWGVLATASLFATDGYPVVAADERGRVDTNATERVRSVSAKLEYRASDRFSTFLRGGYFREARDNGKASTFDGTREHNETRWSSVSAGVQALLPDQSGIQARAFGDVERFHSNFLAVPAAIPPRSIGRVTIDQGVPATSVGGSVQWSKAFAAAQYLTVGGDARWIDGDSDEQAMDAVTGTTVVTHRVSGGSQRSAGAFAQDVIALTGRFQITLSGRVDRWRNYDAHNLETTAATGVPTAASRLLPERTDTVATPRVASIYHLGDRVSAWGSLGWGFRAPTLNELYRQFRVGNVLTLANDQLGPERLVGAEAGINVMPARSVTWRTSWFDNRITDAVSNVTTSVAGQQVVRQRQNLGRTRVWGVQNDVEVRMGSRLRIGVAYLFDHPTVEEFGADPTLVGRLLPQVARHRGTVQLTYTNPAFVSASIHAQFAGRQFDDDRNLLPLPAYALVDLRVSRALTRSIDVFLGIQNLFDRRVIVGANPTTIGAPRLVNGGMRVRLVGD